jgi:hypothetical protein
MHHCARKVTTPVAGRRMVETDDRFLRAGSPPFTVA